MQDTARTNTAVIVRDYLNAVSITKQRDWPARSPDMNPDEQVLDITGRRIRQRNPNPRNMDELKLALVKEWENSPLDMTNNLIEGIGRCIQTLIRARGGNRRY